MNRAVQITFFLLPLIAFIGESAYSDEIAGVFEVDSLSLKLTFEEESSLRKYMWHTNLAYKYRFTNIGGHIYTVNIKFHDVGDVAIETNASYAHGHIMPVDIWQSIQSKGSCFSLDFSPYDSLLCIVTISGSFEELVPGIPEDKIEDRGKFIFSDSVMAPVIFNEE